MRTFILILFAGIAFTSHVHAAEHIVRGSCERPAAGSEVPEPVDLRSRNGTLQVDLTVRNFKDASGLVRYCYLTPDGSQSPTLRIAPGDLLIVRLTNALTEFETPAASAHGHSHGPETKSADPCASGLMSLTATNLHFHGMAIAPVCHQDEVLKTSIAPASPPFEYRFKIPLNQPPGLYWYHPHIHGFSKAQVSGGASGALIIEGIERANADLAGLPERVLIIRDQDLTNPDAPPSKSEPVVPKTLIDRDGDSANNGTGFGRPAKDLTINFVPVPYPDYPPASIKVRPGERQLWRVLNASAITYLNLALIVGRVPQKLGIVAMDGVPLNQNGNSANAVEWRDHIGVPPGARVELVVTAPAAGVPGLLVTRSVDTGQGGENDPNRALATVTADANAAPLRSTLSTSPKPLPKTGLPWLGDVQPLRVRKLYFSEKLQNPNDPNSATDFYLTVDGETPSAFDPSSTTPNITVQQGDVEDWIIENRSNELHDFHIHQSHFLLLEWSGTPVDEPFLRDTVNVPFVTNRMIQYPSVRLRMDFRDPNIVGTFAYHCHLLEHEDGGMMGTIRVEPASSPPSIQAAR
jgi:FtsP/CotA-like multicopper oxidase with cupredoxin domain